VGTMEKEFPAVIGLNKPVAPIGLDLFDLAF
jgi:hypothetical protein